MISVTVYVKAQYEAMIRHPSTYSGTWDPSAGDPSRGLGIIQFCTGRGALAALRECYL